MVSIYLVLWIVAGHTIILLSGMAIAYYWGRQSALTPEQRIVERTIKAAQKDEPDPNERPIYDEYAELVNV